MFDLQQESFIPPEAYQRDRKSMDHPAEPSDLYLLLDKRLLATLAYDYAKSQGTGDIISGKKTLDLLSKYLPRNEPELSEVLFRKDTCINEFTAKIIIGEALPAYFYLLAILAEKSHQDSIQAAESGIIGHYLEHSSNVIGGDISAGALWTLAEMAKPEWSVTEEKYKDVKDVDRGSHQPAPIDTAYEYRQHLSAQIDKMNQYVAAFRVKIGQDPDAPFQDTASVDTPERIMESYRTKYPAELIFPIDKVTGKTFSGELTGVGKKILAMEKAGNKTQISTAVQIDFDNLTGVTFDSPGGLNEYDREVHNAIGTLHLNGNTHFSPQMIYQALTGNPEARLEDKQAEAIRKSLKNLMRCIITIDAADEAKARNWSSDKCSISGPLISWNKVTVGLNGTIVECYTLLQPLPLYTYSALKNQICRADIKLLNSPINKNEEAITLQGYLMRRIMAMKGKSQLTPSILYSTIYEQLHTNASTSGALRKKKTLLRSKVKSILDFWMEQKFISGYRETTKGNAVYSIEISFK